MKKRAAKYKLEVAEDSLDFPEGCTISRYMIQRFTIQRWPIHSS